MKKTGFLSILLMLSFNAILWANYYGPPSKSYYDSDSSRTAELDKYWAEVSRTVREGDFEGYKAAYHPDAVVVFTTGEQKTSVSIDKALGNWKQGFIETKNGKKQDNVEFRFSQRIGDETTAFETGIFHFTSRDDKGNLKTDVYVHFEMLFVKQGNKWLGLMENQKSLATKEEWEALKK